MTSCIGVFKQGGDETSIVWKAHTFDPLSLERQPVVVLNALTGMGLEGYRHQVSQSLFLTLTKEKNPLSVLSLQETIGRFNRAGLGKKVSAMPSDYLRSVILDRDSFKKLAKHRGLGMSFNPVWQPSGSSLKIDSGSLAYGCFRRASPPFGFPYKFGTPMRVKMSGRFRGGNDGRGRYAGCHDSV